MSSHNNVHKQLENTQHQDARSMASSSSSSQQSPRCAHDIITKTWLHSAPNLCECFGSMQPTAYIFCKCNAQCVCRIETFYEYDAWLWSWIGATRICMFMSLRCDLLFARFVVMIPCRRSGFITRWNQCSQQLCRTTTYECRPRSRVKVIFFYGAAHKMKNCTLRTK